ncbi:MAG: transcription termination factor NusA [Thermoguttaceae bacterium]|nr:transcription termination factor NusA [Thermoguttaceae bacterium]
MDAAELLRIVDSIHREKKIAKEIIIAGIESGLLTAAKKYYGDDCDLQVHIDPVSGQISASHNGIPMPAEEISQRIGAQTAKQVMIQKIREAERDTLFDEYKSQIDDIVTGKVHKMERGTAIVQLGSIEAILPFSEMIPKESIKVGDQIRATIAEVKKQGSRVKVILSRIRTHLVKRLFEENIPEIAEGVIEIKGISREPGYRSKVAVVSEDQRIDCVGSCVGVRGNRIKDIKSDLAGEQIDIVPWDPDPMKFIPNALQPAVVEETILCTMLGRAIVLVKEEQLSLGIGKKGQNVRLASKLVGWDIEIMTAEELQETLDKAVLGFRTIPGVSDDLADMLVGEGFISYDDLSIIEPDALQEMGGLSEEEADAIIDEADRRANSGDAYVEPTESESAAASDPADEIQEEKNEN